MNRISDFGLRVASQNQKYASVFCPFHGDKHASGFVYLDNMWFICPVCHISMPLEKALSEAGLDPTGIERSADIDSLDLLGDKYKVQPITHDARQYLTQRGIPEDVPSFVASPLSNSGVAFTFSDNFGNIVGSQIRLFPYNVKAKSYRYVFEGKRLPWFGCLSQHYKNGFRLFVFEKAFATLKAAIAASTFGLPVAAVSAVGSHFQSGLLDMTDVNTTFFFDNDNAGMNAARNVKKQTGARVIVAAKPLDELTIEDMKKHLEKYLT